MNFLRRIVTKLGLPDTNGSIWYVVALMGGVIVLIAYVTIIPLIGYNLDSAVVIPGYINESNHALGGLPGSTWNATINSQIVTSAGLWGSVGPIAKTGAVVAAISAIIVIIMSMAGGFGRRQ
jgi:hypothetical protein